MNSSLVKRMTISMLLLIIVGACKKEPPLTNYVANLSNANNTSPPGSNPLPGTICDKDRPVINANLIPVGSLSSGRTEILTASAGNKILFIGGMHSGQNWWNEPVPADIYDISNNTWAVHWLVPDNPQFTHFRGGAAIASVGNKILFAGGGDGMGDNQTSQVDIYDALTNAWSKTNLSDARQGIVAATIGDKVLFAGGFGYPDGRNWGEFNTVDIYDNRSNSWSTATLSEARMDITAAATESKVYFAGGRKGMNVSTTIDIYDRANNSWSVSSLQQPRIQMAGIANDGKAFWSGGYTTIGPVWKVNDNVEIHDLATDSISSVCIVPRAAFNVVTKNEHIIFFTGSREDNGNQFEIYNTVSGKWSTAVLNQKLQGAAIISVNNTIYVAGGRGDNPWGPYNKQVWKLEF